MTLRAYRGTTSGWADLIDGSVLPAGALVSPVAGAGSVAVGSASYAPPGGAIYMSPAGSDAAAGTLAAPVATLAGAVAKVSAGGTIVLRAGSYPTGEATQTKAYPLGVVVDKAGLTIQNYPGEAAWLDGSQPLSTWTAADGAWWAAYDRVMDRSPTTVSGAEDDPAAGWSYVNPAYPQACWPDMVLIDGVQAEQVTAKDQLGPGKFWVEGSTTSGKWFTATKVWLGEDPAGKAVRYAALVKALTILAADVTLRGIGVRRYASQQPTFGALYLARPNVRLEHVTVEDVSTNAAQLDAVGASLDHVTMRRIGLMGINSNLSDGFNVDRCLFEDTHTAKFNHNPAAGAVKACKTQGFSVTRSVFRRGSRAIWTDQSVYGISIYSNLFEDHQSIAVSVELSGTGVVANNHSHRVGHGHFLVLNADRIRLWNNTTDGIGTEFFPAPSGGSEPWKLYQDNRRPSNTGYAKDTRQPNVGFWDQPQNVWQINTLEACNNITAGVATGARSAVTVDDLERNTGAGRGWAAFGLRVASNVYHWITQPTYPFIYPPAAAGGGSPQVFFNPAAVTTAMPGVEAATTRPAATPLTVDKLPIPTIDHGTAQPLPTDIADLIGQAAGAKRIGAFW